jgi:hypothetical protein
MSSESNDIFVFLLIFIFALFCAWASSTTGAVPYLLPDSSFHSSVSIRQPPTSYCVTENDKNHYRLFFSVLGFQFRATHSLGRRSTT